MPCPLMEELKTHISNSLNVQEELGQKGGVIGIVTNNTEKTLELHVVQCECCGLSEDCTPQYIDQIRTLHCGKWVCGLCEEAVKEEMIRSRSQSRSCHQDMSHALEAHMTICKQFNKPETEKKKNILVNPNPKP